MATQETPNDTGAVRRGRGRPPVTQGGTTVPASVRVPQPVYDRLAQISIHRGVSVSALVRDAVTNFVLKNCR